MTWKLIPGRCLHGTDNDILFLLQLTTQVGTSRQIFWAQTAENNCILKSTLAGYTHHLSSHSNQYHCFWYKKHVSLSIIPLTNTILITWHSIINNFMKSSGSILIHQRHKTRQSIMLADMEVQCHIISTFAHWIQVSCQCYLLATLPHVWIS